MKTTLTPTVDWYAYAKKYDLLLDYNPYYQEVHQQILQEVKKWEIPEGGVIADIGAGTGNYSVAIARMLPHTKVFHIDNNNGMNALAARKANGIDNFEIHPISIEDVDFTPGFLKGLICINAIYTFPEPHANLRRMWDWLAPGGRVVFVDPGRIMNVFGWRLAISRHLIANYGWRKTLEIFKEAKAVGEQNAYIRTMQKNGTYWTHSHEAFCQAISDAGFEIDLATTCFRGDCDLVMGRKVVN